MPVKNNEVLDIIDASPVDVESCFGNHYVVPDYQRDYVWGEKEVGQLFVDLYEAYRNNRKPYFMGMMVVYKGNEGEMEIIDGQQRITTFFMMLSAIEKRAKAAGYEPEAYANYSNLLRSTVTDDTTGLSKKILGLKLQFKEADVCLNNIINNAIPDKDAIAKETQTNRNLYQNYKTIVETFDKDFPDTSELMPFAAFILHKVILVRMVAKDISEALKIFETLNQRGSGLNPLDLLKNMIFMQVDRDEFTELNSKWKEIIDKLSEMNEPPLRFLRYFLTSTYSVVNKNEKINGILPENKIYEWIMAHDDQCHYKSSPFEFIKLMKDRLLKYEQFNNPQTTMLGYSYLTNIKRIGGSTYRYHLLLLLAATNMNDKLLVKFEQILESVVYYYVVNNINANVFEPLVAEWCPRIRKIDDEEKLKTFISDFVIPTIDSWKINNHDNFMMLGPNLQLYRIRFILARVTNFIDNEWEKKDCFQDLDSFFSSGNKIEIEHICPDTIDKTRYAEYGLENEEEYIKYKCMIGNLTLLEKNINSSISNDSYEKKISAYTGSRFHITKAIGLQDNSGSAEAQKRIQKWITPFSTWTKTDIISRQEMIYKICERIWSIDGIINDF